MERPPIEMQPGYRPGLIADIIAAHMAYYAPAWGFGVAFETKLAAEMAAFHQRYDPARDLVLSATDPEGALLGAITIDGLKGTDEAGAHLRWFVTTEAARGRGLGRRLLSESLAFADACGYRRVYLTTFAGLDAAGHLYAQAGFRLVRETAADDWSGGSVGEQLFERLRPATPR